MASKQPFRFIRKWHDDQGRLSCEYEASFWDGPTDPGEVGRYIQKRVNDVVIGGRFLTTSPNVSYFNELRKATGV